MTREFETTDVYLCSGLSILLETRPEYKNKNGKIIFCFPASDELYKALSKLNEGIPINSLKLIETIKRVRSEMMVRRKLESGV